MRAASQSTAAYTLPTEARRPLRAAWRETTKVAIGLMPPCDETVSRPSGTECPDRTGTLLATVAGSSLAFIMGSVVNVALPAMQQSFGAGPVGAQWIVNAYLLPLGALVLIGGALGDRYGRRRIYLLGTTVFAVSSVAAAAAPTLEVLLGARAVMGGPDNLAQALPLVLGGEGHDRRGAAEGGRDAAGIEIVRRHKLGRAFLLDMAMRVDAAGQHQLAAGVDDLGRVAKIGAERDDLPVADTDIGLETVAGGGDPSVSDHKLV